MPLPNTGRVSVGVVALAAILLLLIVAAPAFATPVAEKQARLREVRAELDALGMKVEMAVERYNQAASRLATTRGKIRQNQRLLDAAERNLATATRHLTSRARSVYKAPTTSVMDVVFAARGFNDLVAQFDIMRRLSGADADLVASVTAYERVIKGRRVALKADEKTAVKLVAEQQSRRQAIQARESGMKLAEADLRSEIAAVLARQKATALAAAQAAAQTASSGTTAGGGRTSGGPPPPDPGGPGHPEVVAIAQRYLGIPYLWGGASPKTGFDCSGLVLYVYAQVGVQLLHGATDQQRASSPVPLNALQPGDLVFYGNASYSYHVAIYVGGGQVIEAPRTGSVVSYDGVDDAWIGGRF